jgi:hypothetical protein
MKYCPQGLFLRLRLAVPVFRISHLLLRYSSSTSSSDFESNERSSSALTARRGSS